MIALTNLQRFSRNDQQFFLLPGINPLPPPPCLLRNLKHLGHNLPVLCQQFLPTGDVVMRRLGLVVRVPDAGIFPIQRILVQERALLHMVTKGTGAAVQVVDMRLGDRLRRERQKKGYSACGISPE